jgi:hypothetical protein
MSGPAVCQIFMPMLDVSIFTSVHYFIRTISIHAGKHDVTQTPSTYGLCRVLRLMRV